MKWNTTPHQWRQLHETQIQEEGGGWSRRKQDGRQIPWAPVTGRGVDHPHPPQPQDYSQDQWQPPQAPLPHLCHSRRGWLKQPTTGEFSESVHAEIRRIHWLMLIFSCRPLQGSMDLPCGRKPTPRTMGLVWRKVPSACPVQWFHITASTGPQKEIQKIPKCPKSLLGTRVDTTRASIWSLCTPSPSKPMGRDLPIWWMRSPPISLLVAIAAEVKGQGQRLPHQPAWHLWSMWPMPPRLLGTWRVEYDPKH